MLVCAQLKQISIMHWSWYICKKQSHSRFCWIHLMQCQWLCYVASQRLMSCCPPSFNVESCGCVIMQQQQQLSSKRCIYLYTHCRNLLCAHLVDESMSYALTLYSLLQPSNALFWHSAHGQALPYKLTNQSRQTCKCFLPPTHLPDFICWLVVQLQMCANGQLMSTWSCHHMTRHQALSSAKVTTTMPSVTLNIMVNLMSAPYIQPTPRLACRPSAP